MNATSLVPGASRWLLCLLLALGILFAVPGLTSTAAAADLSVADLSVADAGGQLFASWLQDVVGNRTRLIQASFLFIIVGIFILWKK